MAPRIILTLGLTLSMAWTAMIGYALVKLVEFLL
jgi:hypothetical protein